MTFLPIVERELRVAARRRFTWGSRMAAAAFALLIFGLMLGLSRISGGLAAVGQEGFMVLSRLAFVFACAAGVFLTSDAISEEKREGTLGLLFLTDLRGYDVVLGKWFSHTLRAFYAVLAAFPILALTLLAGGVTGREFALTLLVIVNTLFFSLAAGLLVSTVSWDYMKAVSGAAVVMLLFLGVTGSVDSLLAAGLGRAFQPWFSFASPAWILSQTAAYAHREFWTGLGIQHGIGWGFLLVASLRAPRVWQERGRNLGGARTGLARRWRYGGARARLAMRRRWLEIGPVHWLALRDRWLPRLLVLLVTGLVVFRGSVLLADYWHFWHNASASSATAYRAAASQWQQLVVLGLTLWVAMKASQIFIEAARSGALELLLVTPVRPPAIIQAQWSALWRTFLPPALCIVALNGGDCVLGLMQTNRALTLASAPAVVARNAGTNQAPARTNQIGSTVTTVQVGAITFPSVATSPGMMVLQSASMLFGAVTLLAGLAAVAWFGMWAGISSRTISVAVLKTICFVCVLPWIAFLFVSLFGLSAISLRGGNLLPGGMNFPALMFLTAWTALNLAKDAFFIGWSRKRLVAQFQRRAAQEIRAPGYGGNR
jgi:ABC-type transport system involved in multi-copper enzyme maturation permease subunit